MVIYDHSLFEEFRKKAVTEASQFVTGQTYFSNTYPHHFRLLDLITYREAYEMEGIAFPAEDARENQIGWAKVEYWSEFDAKMVVRAVSLHDRNVGDSYNPWLIFEKEEDRDLCDQQLETSTYDRYSDSSY